MSLLYSWFNRVGDDCFNRLLKIIIWFICSPLKVFLWDGDKFPLRVPSDHPLAREFCSTGRVRHVWTVSICGLRRLGDDVLSLLGSLKFLRMLILSIEGAKVVAVDLVCVKDGKLSKKLACFVTLDSLSLLGVLDTDENTLDRIVFRGVTENLDFWSELNTKSLSLKQT